MEAAHESRLIATPLAGKIGINLDQLSPLYIS
jgi:hypothetical protein